MQDKATKPSLSGWGAVTPDPIPHAPESAGEVLRDLQYHNVGTCPICDGVDPKQYSGPNYHIGARIGHARDCRFANPTPAPSGSDGLIYQGDAFCRLPVSQEQFDGVASQLDGLLLFINGLAARLDVPTEVHMAGAPGHPALANWIVKQCQAPSGDEVADLRARVRVLEKRIHNQRAALRLDWQIQERRNRQSRIRLDAVRRAIAARRAAEARCKAMEEALWAIRAKMREEVEVTDEEGSFLVALDDATVMRDIDNILSAALSQHQKGEGHA